MKVVFDIDNEEAAKHFLVWLSEMGEQMYWEWMANREFNEEGDITVLQFGYDLDKFTVKTLVGRLDECE